MNSIRFRGPSSVQQLLDKEDCTLQDLLKDNELINELQFGNSNLVKFLNRDKIVELVHYLLKEPPEGCSQDRGHRFPFMACEVFKCEIQEHVDMFFTSRAEVEESQAKDKEEENESEYDDENAQRQTFSGERPTNLEEPELSPDEPRDLFSEIEKEAQEAKQEEAKEPVE